LNQRFDVAGFGAAMLSVALIVWTGLAGPLFTFSWDANALAAAGSWAQAVFTALAIFGAYWVAMTQVREQNAEEKREQARQAAGLKLFLIGDIIALQGEISRAIKANDLMTPIHPPGAMIARADSLYLLDDLGSRLLQTLGFLNGVNRQIDHYNSLAKNASPADRVRAFNGVAANNRRLFTLALTNIDEVVDAIYDETAN
jgi:hypothetical protein